MANQPEAPGTCWVLTNDDGIDAPGLLALAVATDHAPHPRVVYAPVGPQSGCAHVVTTHAPIRVSDHAPGRWAVDGSPADCVRVALHRLGGQVDWVVSGINPGGNLGTDIYHSGTVAAVREAALHGVPGIALSHYIKRGKAIDWDRTTRWAARVIADLMARPHVPGTFWNVNFPHLDADDPEPELVPCPVDPSPLPLGYRETPEGLVYQANYHERPRRPGSDVDVCFGGQISVSRISVDLPAT